MSTLNIPMAALAGVTGLVVKLYAWTAPATIVNGTGDDLIEVSTGLFEATVTESLAGWHSVHVFSADVLVFTANADLGAATVTVNETAQLVDLITELTTASDWTPPPATPLAGELLYSDQYLYWDNTQTATVNLDGIWNPDTEEYDAAAYEDVIVRRVSQVTQMAQFSGLSLRNDQAFWLVPFALIGGNSIKDGDTITVGSNVWVATGDAPLTTVGSSPSHYVVLTHKQRG